MKKFICSIIILVTLVSILLVGGPATIVFGAPATVADDMYWFIVSDGVEEINHINSQTVENRENVEILVLPPSLKKIGHNVFNKFPKLKYVYMYTRHDIASNWDIGVGEIAGTQYDFTVYGYDNAKDWIQLMNFPYTNNNMGVGNHMPQSNFINFIPMEQSEYDWYGILESESSNVPVSSDIKVFLNGQQIYFDVQPMVYNERVMLPVRAIYEAMGAEVEWQEETQSVLATKWNESTQGIVSVKIEIGSDIIINSFGEMYDCMDAPAMIVNGRTLVTLRGIAESFNYDVEWDGAANAVYINDKPLESKGF